MAHVLQPVRYADLAGWQSDTHDHALAAFHRSAKEILGAAHGFKQASRFGGNPGDWADVCQQALTSDQPARLFFESHFTPLRVVDPEKPNGLFTGYYEPEALGSRTATKDCTVPIYGKPADLISFDAESAAGLKYGRLLNGLPMAYFTREEIENGALQGRDLEIVWLESWADAFFIHIQGSGRVRLADGSSVRLAYAAKTGLPYTGIGGVLVKRGMLTPESNSMQSIRAWMANNPDAARALMWQNQSFVFFREITVADESLGALGAQQVNLTPNRSLAVDRSLWAFGTPIWLSTTTPPESPGGAKPFTHLLVAQDTGSAIKGLARGDVYWGWGNTAAQIAGHMKSTGTMTVLLPNALANTLLEIA